MIIVASSTAFALLYDTTNALGTISVWDSAEAQNRNYPFNEKYNL